MSGLMIALVFFCSCHFLVVYRRKQPFEPLSGHD